MNSERNTYAVMNFLMVNRTNDLLVARLVLWMLVVTEKYWRRNIREEKELTEKNYSNTTWPPNIVWRDSAFAWRLKNYVVIGRIKNWDCRMKMICSSVDRELFPRIGGTEKNLSMTIANQIVRRLIVRRMARPNWYEEWKLKMFAGGFVESFEREESRARRNHSQQQIAQSSWKKGKHKDGPFVKSCTKFNKIKLIKGRDICSLKMRLEISLLVRINSVINSVWSCTF